jgi:Ca-activated chloride channel family protein
VPAQRCPFFRRSVDAAGADPGPGAVVLSRTRLQMTAALAAWLLIVLALAEPERVGEPVEITKAARDVVLAIDISGSMDARDFLTPEGERKQRLEAVRDVVRSFVAGREEDRMALIVFGTKAYVQAPLTEDLDTVVDLLDPHRGRHGGAAHGARRRYRPRHPHLRGERDRAAPADPADRR